MGDRALWAVAATHPNAAGIASRHLRRQGFSFYDPRTWSTVRLDSGRLVQRKVQLFQDYIFVQVVDQWRALRSTSGVRDVLMSAPEKPASIPPEFIAELQGRERNGCVILPKFRRGDRLVLTKGTQEIVECVFDCADRRDRVFVLLNLLGGARRVSVREGDLAAA